MTAAVFDSAVPSGGELLDFFSEDGSLLGQAERDVVHRRGLWHHTFHAWILTRIDGRDHLLLQRRSATSSGWAHKLDVTAAGHLLAGESAVDGVRELAEEVGVHVDFAALEHIGDLRICSQEPFGSNREVAKTYLLRDDRPLGAYRFADGEVEAIVAVPVEQLAEVIAGGCGRGWQLHVRSGLRPIELTAADLVPKSGSYWSAVLNACRR